MSHLLPILTIAALAFVALAYARNERRRADGNGGSSDFSYGTGCDAASDGGCGGGDGGGE